MFLYDTFLHNDDERTCFLNSIYLRTLSHYNLQSRLIIMYIQRNIPLYEWCSIETIMDPQDRVCAIVFFPYTALYIEIWWSFLVPIRVLSWIIKREIVAHHKASNRFWYLHPSKFVNECNVWYYKFHLVSIWNSKIWGTFLTVVVPCIFVKLKIKRKKKDGWISTTGLSNQCQFYSSLISYSLMITYFPSTHLSEV